MTNNDKIYYAVRVGRKPGVYKNANKAIAQVKGYPKGDMRKIKGLEVAETYVRRKNKVSRAKPKTTKDVSSTSLDICESVCWEKESFPTVYVDGSYMENVAVSSYGFVVHLHGEEIQKDFGLILDRHMLDMKSLGSELYACLRAIEWGIANGHKQIRIIYDCEGIIHAIQSKGRNKKQTKGKENFLKLFTMYNEHIKIYFRRANSILLNKNHKKSHHLSRVAVGVIEYNRDFKGNSTKS